MVEVTNISIHGFWLLLPSGEVFLPFDQFPWFREATIRQVQNIVLERADHLRWPDLDVDLELDSILHPERYPLVSKAGAPQTPRDGAGKVADRKDHGTPDGSR
jgi:hypothetical protein